MRMNFKHSMTDSQSGFSLLEVMIAITIFAIFITAYITSEGYNMADSGIMKKELILQKLCKEKLLEITLNPPVLTDALTLIPKTGNFEESGHPDYEYKIEYKKLKIPDLSQIEGTQGEEDSGGESSDSDSLSPPLDDEGESSPEGDKKSMEKQIFNIMKKNIEELIWQVRVTVNEKGTQFPFALSTLIKNPKAKVQVNF